MGTGINRENKKEKEERCVKDVTRKKKARENCERFEGTKDGKNMEEW